MGMAASQARYLGLTARKTNVEYEGQQVNQQRTALANQSANLFNQLMSFNVPVPPSTTDYTKVQYEFSDGTNQETITNISPLATTDPDYNYTVTYYHDTSTYTGVETKTTNPQVKKGTSGDFSYVGNSAISKADIATEHTITTPVIVQSGGVYTTVDGHTLSAYDSETDSTLLSQITAAYPTSNIASATPASEVFKYTDTDGTVRFVCKDDLDTAYNGGGAAAPLDNYYGGTTTQSAAVAQILKDLPNSQFAQDYAADHSNIYTYQSGGQTYFACKTDLNKSYDSTSGEIDNQTALNRYNSTYLDKKIYTTEKASIQQDGTGQFTSIKLENSSAVYDLDATTTTDTIGYENAMSKYNYDVAVYEKQVQDINAKTSVIQQEDRTLELRLRQLDTEQKALSTEMDAVKKVIDKNIESTFKTFSS